MPLVDRTVSQLHLRASHMRFSVLYYITLHSSHDCVVALYVSSCLFCQCSRLPSELLSSFVLRSSDTNQDPPSNSSIVLRSSCAYPRSFFVRAIPIKTLRPAAQLLDRSSFELVYSISSFVLRPSDTNQDPPSNSSIVLRSSWCTAYPRSFFVRVIPI